MAKLSILAGSTSQSVNVFIQNSSLTTGAGLTGLVFNTSSLTSYYTFSGTSAAATAITLATLAAVNSAFSSGGFKEIDATNMPGLYRLDIPDAALAGSSGRSVVVMLKGAANMAPCLLEIELTAIDNQSTSFGLVLTGITVGTVTNLTALTSTTYPESSGVVAATATLKDSIVWLKTLSRNRITQTSTTETLYADDATTPVATSADSDNGTTFERGEWA